MLWRWSSGQPKKLKTVVELQDFMGQRVVLLVLGGLRAMVGAVVLSLGKVAVAELEWLESRRSLNLTKAYRRVLARLGDVYQGTLATTQAGNACTLPIM